MSGYIICTIIFFIILYFVIQAAIDNSNAAYEIMLIRKLLEKQYLNTDSNAVPGQDDIEPQECEILNVPFDTCPACGAKVTPTDAICPECGLTLNK